MSVKYFENIKRRFLKLVPPPRFLTMPAAGLNISDHSIKILELEHGHKKSVKQFGEEPIPDGVIKYGTINDKEALKKILVSIKKKYRLSFVRISLPEEKAYVFTTKIPKSLDDKQIRANIEFQLEDNVPISSNEAFFDYTIISDSTSKGDVVVSVSVLPQKVVASFLGFFEESGLTPISFEIEAESILRAVLKTHDTGTYMIVDYGRTRTGFSVISGGAVQYTSTAEIGGDPITKIIMEHFKVSLKEAEHFKNDKGLVKDSENPELYMTLANIVSVLKDEINKRYIFWHTHKDGNKKVGEKIQKIILVGGNSNLYGLEDYLSNSLKVKVERADIWNNVFMENDEIPPINFRDSMSYASAVGLALREFGS